MVDVCTKAQTFRASTPARRERHDEPGMRCDIRTGQARNDDRVFNQDGPDPLRDEPMLGSSHARDRVASPVPGTFHLPLLLEGLRI